jgi:hypothetical protein
MFLPLISSGAALVATMAIGLCGVSDALDARRASLPALLRRSAYQLALSILGLGLLVPVAARVLRWVID